MLEAAEDDVIESKTRRKIIIENEFDPLMPRVANVENCIGKDICIMYSLWNKQVCNKMYGW